MVNVVVTEAACVSFNASSMPEQKCFPGSSSRQLASHLLSEAPHNGKTVGVWRPRLGY